MLLCKPPGNDLRACNHLDCLHIVMIYDHSSACCASINILARQDRSSMVSCGCEQGETNASWVMDGMLEQLLSNTELGVRLRSHFVSAIQLAFSL